MYSPSTALPLHLAARHSWEAQWEEMQAAARVMAAGMRNEYLGETAARQGGRPRGCFCPQCGQVNHKLGEVARPPNPPTPQPPPTSATTTTTNPPHPSPNDPTLPCSCGCACGLLWLAACCSYMSVALKAWARSWRCGRRDASLGAEAALPWAR